MIKTCLIFLVSCQIALFAQNEDKCKEYYSSLEKYQNNRVVSMNDVDSAFIKIKSNHKSKIFLERKI